MYVSRRPRARIVIGSRDIERRAIAGQWLRRGETDRPEDDVADERDEREVLFRLADMLRTPCCRRVSAGIGQPGRRVGGGDRGGRRADVESRVGRSRHDVPSTRTLRPDDDAAGIDRHGHPGRFCSNTAERTSSRARDGRRILRPGRRNRRPMHRLRLREDGRSAGGSAAPGVGGGGSYARRPQRQRSLRAALELDGRNPGEAVDKKAGLRRFADEPVAAIVQCGEPTCIRRLGSTDCLQFLPCLTFGSA